jgi:hypothetical protein|uniref:Uncharacterized protein n=1 Tax=Siphoviridae sp. ctt5z12 TaxID=2823604 RepID=A0A8S5LBR6_9CAUD|nr:MAG TPA: hypothetical protein [Siphoviridae sp. ctt5z12]
MNDYQSTNLLSQINLLYGELKLANDIKLFELIKAHAIDDETLKVLGVKDEWVKEIKAAINGSAKNGTIKVVGA